MLEATIILPAFGRFGEDISEAHVYLRERLCADHGGVTITTGLGYDPTTPAGEPVQIYTVAYERGRQPDVMRAAISAWRRAGQLFGYIKTDGDVNIVDMSKTGV
jgi:hypothetical protein